jgi:hypothetical protein
MRKDFKKMGMKMGDKEILEFARKVRRQTVGLYPACVQVSSSLSSSVYLRFVHKHMAGPVYSTERSHPQTEKSGRDKRNRAVELFYAI